MMKSLCRFRKSRVDGPGSYWSGTTGRTLAVILIFGGFYFSAANSALSQQDHWAFRPPVRPSAPVVKDRLWSRHPIDPFILARLEKKGRQPAREADRLTLLRRLTLDLTGLPPSPQAITDWTQDRSPNAYQKLLDRLLASPYYGERWTLWWLDAVRYADSNGYESDRARSIWAYRDWVIDSLNSDMPFDQFAVEQVAGDMLPHASLGQRIATGFHRHTYINEEGGHDWEQFRWESIVDRVNTTATIFLGLTFACAQCHNHKYDSISQREYWRFFALLNNMDEPFLDVPASEILRQRGKLQAEIARLEASREKIFPLQNGPGEQEERDQRSQQIDRKFAAWHQRESATANRWSTLEPVQFVSQMNATLSALEDHSILATGDRPEIDEYRVIYKIGNKTITGFLLEALPHPALPRGGPGRGSFMGDGSFALSELVVDLATQKNAGGSAAVRRVGLKDPLATLQHKTRSVELAIDGDRLTHWQVNDQIGQAQWAIFASKQPLLLQDEDQLQVTYLMNFIHQQSLGRFRLSVTDDDKPLVLPVHPREILDLLMTAPADWSPGQRQRLRRYFLSVTPELAECNQNIRELHAQMPPLPTTMVVTERKHARATHFHHRGEFSQPGELVKGQVPHLLHPLPAGEPPNRLALARWLVSPQNPLVGRVIMNQSWQQFFGQGIVTTTEDFGSQGDLPTHPLLLDWLATEFFRNAWSLKTMHRLIASSAVYRQSAVFGSKDTLWDPKNQWLARGPRVRVDAETVRDIALQASGLLNSQIGGPSFFPPRADLDRGDVAFAGLRWKVNQDGNRYRRGLYIFRKRSAPHPALATFDAPPRNTCRVKRRRSNTPLQALVLLNDECTTEAARTMAGRVLREGPPDDDGRIRYAFRRCLTRTPNEAEISELLFFLREQAGRLQTDNLDALAIAGGENVPQGTTLHQLAAWTTVARVLLNLDETITKQ